MNKVKLRGIFFLMVFLVFSNLILAQSKEDSDVQEYLQFAIKNMSPGPMHRMLAKSVGNWTAEVKAWPQPDADSLQAVLETKNEMILGGRYLQSRTRGSMRGLPFEALNWFGYDNNKKAFLNISMDNMGTGIMFFEGFWDEDSKTITFSFKNSDSLSGQPTTIRELFKFIDENNQLLEMYTTIEEKEYKSMEIKYIRKPDPEKITNK